MHPLRSSILPLLIHFLHLSTAQNQIRDILGRSDRRPFFDSLSEIIENEYKNKTVSSDDIPEVRFQRREVSITEMNEHLQDILFEGDIVVTPQFLERIVDSSLQRQERREKRQATHDDNYPKSLWSDGIAYVISPNLSSNTRRSILRAISFWQSESCVDFWERRNEVQYLHFINGDGCWSSVGKDQSNGPQSISIGNGCSHFGVTSHELAHALGLYHEQSRYDRDNYVTLNTQRVPRSLLYNFAKIGANEMSTYNLPYDIGSVMHYAPTEFAIDRRFPALTAIDPNLQFSMGSLIGPSFVDIALLNTHYNCASKCLPNTLDCLNGGLIDSRDCTRCKCPTGFGGILCDQVQSSFTPSCGGIVQVGEDVRRFTITIRQNDTVRDKQCVYHLQGPDRRRILINVLSVDARCVEGCHIDMAEFKMLTDLRPVGYRVCCNEQRGSRFVSVGSTVPALFLSSANTFSFRFEYTLYSHRAVRSLSKMKTEHPYSSEIVVGVQ